MVLTVDIGNSNIVIGGVEGDDIVFEARLRTESTKTSDQYCVDLKILLDVYHINVESIEGSIIASVVPQVLNSFQTAIKKLTGKTSLVVGPGLKTGLNIRLENPGQTGADLVVGCVAALREHKPPMIIVDMGTATTMVVLDETGALIGGCICPGVKISMDALTDRTALLPVIVMTADQEAEVECLNLGATDFIPKPYPKQEVVLARILRTIELFEDRDIIRWTERDQLTGLYNKEYFLE